MSESFTRDLESYATTAVVSSGRAKAITRSGFSPITNRHFVVDQQMKSRHTANAVLKQAGISQKY
jgi:hypothetical protein